MNNSDVEIIQLLFIGTAAFLVLFIGFISIYIKYVRNISKEQKKLLELENKYKDELLENVLESIEIERTRIARDLHDQIGNTFSLLSLVLQQTEGEKIKEAQLLIATGLSNTHELVYQIMPPDLQLFGLEYALEEMCVRISKSGKLTAECFIDCDIKQYNPRVQLSIYRIIQELITNTIKHSNASRLTLNFDDIDTGMRVLYRDNGTLKNEDIDHQRKGYGLRNIESRVQSLNGSFEFNFKKGFESSILMKSFYAD